ncbi:MAG: hypothetical protein A2Y77_08835 [Planctomycetes bacterium RBG_13_62_9]|nr:MAG: hypothetical protein A2Y77_08835 [Planctomycetes bacterium RBG_13_62_9]
MPLSISDESKPQGLKATVPVMGTPMKVRLERYLPDLRWETTVVEDPNGGPVAKLSLRGEGLLQDVWLCARDRERQSISAHVGSVAIRELPGQTGTEVLQELTDPDVVGILLIWLSDTDSPLAYAVKPGKTVSLPRSPWKLSVLKYTPHYSVDRQTKEVTSLSDKPENPAVEIRVEGGKQEYRQWLWSLFASSPHQEQQLPFRARFVDFHPGTGAGRYILAAPEGSPSYLLHLKDGKKHIEQVEPGKRYPFEDGRYSFGVDEVRPGARVVTTWKEGSEVLLNPAVVATIIQSTSAQQVLLELGKPYHHKTSSGTLVVLYRRVPDSSKQ